MSHILRRLREPRWALAALGALLIASLVARSAAVAAVEAPQLLCDEFIHAAEARGLWGEGRYAFRGEPAAPHSLLAPVLFGPAQLAPAADGVYSALKALNVLLVTLTAIPVFLLARRLMRIWWAVAAAGLALALPGLAFAGLVMTESAFFPAVALAVLLIARAVEVPTASRQALALGGIAVAAAIRPQGLVLALAMLAAAPLHAAFEARAGGGRVGLSVLGAGLGRMRLSLVVLAGLAVIVPLARLVRGDDGAGALGPYRAVIEADYAPGAIGESAGLHLAYLPLAAAVIPVTALVIMTACAWRPGGTRDGAERAFLAVALTGVVATLAVTIGFASAFTDEAVMERYFFSVLPVMMVVLALWLDRGLPRPPVATAVGAVLPVAVVAGVPFARYLDDGVPLDAPSAMVLPRIADATGWSAAGVAAAIVAAAGAWAALAALAPRRIARVSVPAGVAAALVGSSIAAADRVQEQSAFPRSLAGPSPTWIDDAAGRDAEVVYLDLGGAAPELERGGLALQAEFWNRSVERWAFVGATPCGLPAEAVVVAPDGSLTIDGPAGDHVVAPREYIMEGDRAAVVGRLALTRTNGPLAVVGHTEGVAPDGWVGEAAAIAVRRGAADGISALVLELDRPGWTARAAPSPITIAVRPQDPAAGPPATWRVAVPAAGRRRVRVPLPPGPATIGVRADRTFTIEDLGLPAPDPGRRFAARLEVESESATPS